MADQAFSSKARGSTEPISSGRDPTGCPTWDTLGGGRDLPPFFNPGQELKRQGFRVRFLSDHPRRETPSAFDGRNSELWFDIEHEGRTLTWTISQISLLLELKKHAPLNKKVFFIQLVPVDEDFRRKRPQYRGKDRYVVKPIEEDFFEEIIEPSASPETGPPARAGCIESSSSTTPPEPS